QYKCSGVDFDDLVQEGGIGLVSAVRFFKSDAGAAFKTFACLCIRRQILSAMRNASKRDIISLDYVRNLNSNVENPEDVV
ncbi:sigma factor, partial [Rhodanobacter spathiphylli]